MTIVIERYTSEEGNKAEICINKDCAALCLKVFKPIKGTPFARPLFRNYYTTKKTAKQAMKRFGTGWKREAMKK